MEMDLRRRSPIPRGMSEGRSEGKSSSFYGEMDPALLPTIIKKGTSMMEETRNEKIPSWKEVFRQPRVIGTIVGVILAIVVLFIPVVPDNPKVQRTLSVLILMATCWVTEIIPLSITALFPVVLFPFLGVLSASTVSQQYFNNTIFMFLAGFLLSLAMERWNLHIRIALFITSFFERPRSILFGVMFAAYFLSMWISNTAAALMMVANITALVETLEDHYGKQKMASFSKAVMIGIAFACNIGGFGTLIGTPPNMTFTELFNKAFSDKEGVPDISFSNWLFAVLPANFLLFLLDWAYFAIFYCPSEKELHIDKGYCKSEYKKLGPASYEEKVVFIAFIALALLWLFRADMEFGSFTLPGWSNIFGKDIAKCISDGSVGMLIVLLLFVIPTKKCLKRKNKDDDDACIMTWNTAKKLPWDLVLLFGGGFALAEACKQSGLSNWIGNIMIGMQKWPIFLAVLVMTLLMCCLTSFTSNTATASIVLPIMIGISQSIQRNPIMMMVPMTIAASCAFLLPIGTPPNLVVFASKRLTMLDMIKAGTVTTVLAVAIIMLITFVTCPMIFKFDINEFPDWAKPDAA